jgi:hypothetical protein
MAGTIDVCVTTIAGMYIDNLAGTLDFLTVTFCLTAHASIDNNESLNAIMPSPNPASFEFYIKGLTEKTIVQIFASDARLLFNDYVNVNEAINIDHLNRVLYAVKLFTEGSIITKTIVKS